MAKFKIIVSESNGKASSFELEGPKAQPLVGRQLGEEVDGSILGLTGQTLRITGGSDKDGIPMRPGVHGGAKKRVILASGAGFRSTSEGERRRKLVRGEMITEETYQLNMKTLAAGEERAAPVEEAKETKEQKPTKRTRRKSKEK
ncbi:MAG: 30S ribosomal protein S6e [archaeon]